VGVVATERSRLAWVDHAEPLTDAMLLKDTGCDNEGSGGLTMVVKAGGLAR
jgi:hypothetical protein